MPKNNKLMYIIITDVNMPLCYVVIIIIIFNQTDQNH